MNVPRSLSVVIPAYNEAGTIAEVVRRVRAADAGGLALEIVVVDDGSTDGTAAAVRELPGVKAVLLPANRGKGAALRAGLEAAAGDVLLIQDADLEYDPADYPALLAPLLEGRADLVMGSRFAFERPRFFFGRRRSPFFSHYIGNHLIILATNVLYGQSFTDYEGCYKAFTREALGWARLKADGFELDNELVCRLLRRGARVVEVPIRYDPRTYEGGKKIRWTDGLRMLWTILRCRFE